MENSIEAVLERAVAAQKRWKQVPVPERVAVCRRMTEWCVARADLLGEELTRQMGRPIAYSPNEIRRGFSDSDIVKVVGGNVIRALRAAQAVALVPGSSRSGVTITGGLFCGLSREAAARFSFLCSLPSIFGAGVYELYKERELLLGSQSDAVNLLAATVASASRRRWKSTIWRTSMR